MTVFAGARVNRQQPWLWLAAIAAALILHGAIAWFFWWQPESKLVLTGAAAPVVFEVSMVAAPKAAVTALPIGPQQQETALAMPPPVQLSAQPPIETRVEIDSVINPLVDIKTAVVINTPPDTPPLHPVEKSPPLETKPDVESSEPVEPLPVDDNQPQESQPVESNNNSDNTGDQSVVLSSAPLTLQAPEAAVVSAPAVGALNQHESAAKSSWKNSLQAHLERRKRYPRTAQMRGHQGGPWVRFTMNRAGKVLKVELYRASGYAALDKEVVALVLRAQPLPPPPEDVPGELLTLAVPVAFHRG